MIPKVLLTEKAMTQDVEMEHVVQFSTIECGVKELHGYGTVDVCIQYTGILVNGKLSVQ